ncbi:GTP-binding protein [Microbispora sp. GKU 823]|uniref:GTP-binding protein n=1 Tax=Microbispora sp. GKU 823 TaxID=1652100 RepID=UPI002118E2E1|nr:GTP-binding protein [Microbispora sp. GKU 823]
MHVVATAGHVDHGKSTLVRALTGMEPDRLAEERRRGLTIELGYAWTTLPSGERVAFVDVPGHERFLGTMLAGVGPVPAVMFVVAADEGWMPQSEEHLVAVRTLGVRHGLLAVTRADLGDPAPALEDARDRLAAAGLGDVEALAVSGRTGEGLDGLRAALDRLVAALPAPDPRAPVRLWIDRAFSVRGSGTVVTGTLPAGRVEVGDELELDGEPVRVRGLESLKEHVESVTGVARVALNLRGRIAPQRGHALVTPGAWTTTSLADVRVTMAEGARGPLPARLTAHIGSASVPCEVRPLGPGDRGGGGPAAPGPAASPAPGRRAAAAGPGPGAGRAAGARAGDRARRAAPGAAPPGGGQGARQGAGGRVGRRGLPPAYAPAAARRRAGRDGLPARGTAGGRRLARRPRSLVGAVRPAPRGRTAVRGRPPPGARDAGGGRPPRAGPARPPARDGARTAAADGGRRADHHDGPRRDRDRGAARSRRPGGAGPA